MRLVGWETLVDNGFSACAEFHSVRKDITDAIDLIRWPTYSDRFTIYGDKGRGRGEGNGVKPIKDAFIEHLKRRGWVPEHFRFDAYYTFATGVLPFVVEWETGNISSSHRAVNRIALGMLRTHISGGVLVVPSGALYAFLTDRVGNAPELAQYHQLWRLWSDHSEFGYLAIAVVEHNDVSLDVPRIKKGTDGRALA